MEHVPLSPPSPYTDTLCLLFIFFLFLCFDYSSAFFPPFSLSVWHIEFVVKSCQTW